MDRFITLSALREMFLKDEQSRNEAIALLYSYKDSIIKHLERFKVNLFNDEIHDSLTDAILILENNIRANKYDTGEYRPRPFVINILSTLVLEQFREKRLKPFFKLEKLVPNFDISSKDIERKRQLEELYLLVNTFLQTIPEESKLLFYSHYFLDMTSHEISEIFKIDRQIIKQKQF